MSDSATVVLSKTKECSSVVRYDHPDKKFKVIKTLYISNEAYEKIGAPDKIALIIKAHD